MGHADFIFWLFPFKLLTLKMILPSAVSTEIKPDDLILASGCGEPFEINI